MKKVLVILHRWVGLVLVMFVLTQAGTGLLLVNKDALEPRLHAGSRVEARSDKASLDAVLAALHETAPTLKVDRIYTSQHDDRALTARLVDEKRRITIALVDPADAHVISSGRIKDYPLQLSERLHVSLMQGTGGQLTLLIEGICLVFMSISGVVVWWPSLKRLKTALTIHAQSGMRRFVRELHIVPGVLAAVFIGISAFTGASIIADPLIKPLVARVAPVSPEISMPDLPAPADGVAPLSAQEGLDKLRQRFLDARLRQIRFLGPQERLMGVVMESSRTLNPRSHHLAAVDRVTGSLFVWSDGDALPSGEAVLSWLLPTHTGEILGPVREVLMSLMALTLIVLTITGTWTWIAKPRRKRA